MSSTATLNSVRALKESLQKSLPLLDSDDAAVAAERCRDILDRLDECDMTLHILQETLIGATVSRLKAHEQFKAQAKALIKKWKKIAVQEEQKSAETVTVKKEKTSPAVERRESGSAVTVKEEKTSPGQAAAERRGSGGSNLSDSNANGNGPEEEWAGLPPLRQNICQKLFDLFKACKPDLIQAGVNKAAIAQITGPPAVEVEAAIYEQHGNDKKAYTDKARSLAFNLKKNRPLSVNVILGVIAAADLVKMPSEELASEETRKAMQEQAKKVIDSRRLDWDQAHEDKINKMCGIKGDMLKASLFTCGRCKSHKTTSTQKQTRSADEPMTVFVLCLNCGKRWRC